MASLQLQKAQEAFRIPPPMSDEDRKRTDDLLRVVDNACNEMIISVDWTLNMQLVDMLNGCTTQLVISETVRGLRKKLLSKSSRTVMLALALAETLVKNCGMPVHREMASEKFMATMAGLAKQHAFKTSRESLQIADKALDLVQAWGEAFLPMRREVPRFVETYHQLRKEGMPFQQQYKEDRPPVLAPGGGTLLDQHSREASQAAAPPSYARSGGGPPPYCRAGGNNGGGNGNNGGFGAASAPELLSTVTTATEMMQSVLSNATSVQAMRDEGVAADLALQLAALSPRMTALIERRVEEGDVDNIEALFRANDALDAALQAHKDALAGKVSLPLPLPSGRFHAANAAAQAADLLGGMTLDESGAPTPAAAATAAASKPVPTLAAPPSAAPRGGGGGARGGSADGGDFFDLLTGESSGSAAAAAPAPAPMAIDFSAFAVPAPGSSAAAAGAPSQQQQPPLATPTLVAGGQAAGGGGASSPPRQNLFDLNALYASGAPQQQQRPAGMGGVAPMQQPMGLGINMAGGSQPAQYGSPPGGSGAQVAAHAAGGGLAGSPPRPDPFATMGSGVAAPAPAPVARDPFAMLSASTLTPQQASPQQQVYGGYGAQQQGLVPQALQMQQQQQHMAPPPQQQQQQAGLAALQPPPQQTQGWP